MADRSDSNPLMSLAFLGLIACMAIIILFGFTSRGGDNSRPSAGRTCPNLAQQASNSGNHRVQESSGAGRVEGRGQHQRDGPARRAVPHARSPAGAPADHHFDRQHPS